MRASSPVTGPHVRLLPLSPDRLLLASTKTSGPPAGPAVREGEARGERDHLRAQSGAGLVTDPGDSALTQDVFVKETLSLCLRHPILGPLPEREGPKADREETPSAEGGGGGLLGAHAPLTARGRPGGGLARVGSAWLGRSAETVGPLWMEHQEEGSPGPPAAGSALGCWEPWAWGSSPSWA